MKKNIVLSMVILLSAVLVPAEAADRETLSFSLDQACDFAVANNLEAINARLDVIMAARKTWETTAIGLPQLSAAMSYTNMLKIPTTLIPAQFFDPDAGEDDFIDVKFGTQHNASLELTATQLIFNGSYIVGLQAAKVYQQLSKNQLEKKEIDIREAVSRTYYLTLMAEDNLKILEQTRANLKQSVYEVGELFKAGFVEEADVDQLNLNLADLDSLLVTSRNQVELTGRLLKFQLGLELEVEIELTDTLQGILAEIQAPETYQAETDLSRHIDYRIVETQEQSMALLLKREKSEFLPTITAFFNLSRSAMRNSFNFLSRDEKWFPASVLGLNVSLPIFSSGQRLARVAQARLELRKAENLKKQVADSLQLALDRARSEYREAYERVENSVKTVNLARRIYENSRIKFNKGMLDTMSLTQVHNQYLNSESNRTQALVALFNARNELEKAMNRL
jgi:outer membrane protein